MVRLYLESRVKRFSHAKEKCSTWSKGCGLPAGRTIFGIEELQHTYRKKHPFQLALVVCGTSVSVFN